MRRSAIGFALASLAVLSPRDAEAAGAVIGKEGETVSVRSARVAVASAPGRTALWVQVGVTGASAGFVWILPVRKGARIDLGSDAWLDSLDAATSPVVLPPSTATPNTCDAGLSPQRLPPMTSPQSGLPVATGLFTDRVALDSFVTSAGFAIPAELASALAPVLAGGAVIASTYATDDRPVRTLRIVDSGPPLLPFALTGAAGLTAQATAFVIASAGAAAGSSPALLDPSLVTWVGDGLSTLVPARADLLDSWQGTRWLTESAAPGLLFDGAVIGPGATLPAVVARYFSLAQTYGDATGYPTGCATAALSEQGDSDPYVAMCPVGTLGIVPGPSPCSNDADSGVSDGTGRRCPHRRALLRGLCRRRRARRGRTRARWHLGLSNRGHCHADQRERRPRFALCDASLEPRGHGERLRLELRRNSPSVVHHSSGLRSAPGSDGLFAAAPANVELERVELRRRSCDCRGLFRRGGRVREQPVDR